MNNTPNARNMDNIKIVFSSDMNLLGNEINKLITKFYWLSTLNGTLTHVS
jgi:hypothetical protein